VAISGPFPASICQQLFRLFIGVRNQETAIGDTELMGADIPSAQPMRSAYLSLGVESDAEAERIFAALSDGGRVFMPMQETFFATRFAQLQDRFGINWMIIRDKPGA
jgi:PhnB protein